MGAWSYYSPVDYYEKDISSECSNCEKEFEVCASVSESNSTAYWQCPECKSDNETRIK